MTHSVKSLALRLDADSIAPCRVISWRDVGTAFNDAVTPYMKIGIYKWGWEVPRAYDVKNAEVTFSELRVGGAGSSYAEVDTAPPSAPRRALVTREVT